MKSIKKAFTIVELVIVIAVVAILAAVLIPTFSGVIEKSHQSTDVQLVKNLNTAISLEKQSQGNPNAIVPTAHDAVRICEAAGYLADAIVAKSSQLDIAWSADDNYFVLINTETAEVIFPSGEGVVRSNADGNKVNYFVFRTSMPVKNTADAEYSLYAGKGFDAGNGVIEINSVGFDAGYNTNIKTVSYANNGAVKGVVIRTNGGDLSVNDPTGDVNIYGAVNQLTVLDAAPSSVHIFDAVVAKLIVNDSDGHVVVESGATVAYLEANAGSVDVANESSVIAYYAATSSEVKGAATTAKKDTKASGTECATHTHVEKESNGIKCTYCSVCYKLIKTEATQSYIRIDTNPGNSTDPDDDNPTNPDDDNPTNPDDNNDNPNVPVTPTSGYSITVFLTNVTANANNPTSIEKEAEDIDLYFEANSGYQLPLTIIVENAEFIWNDNDKKVRLWNPTGNVSITIVGESTGGGSTPTKTPETWYFKDEICDPNKDSDSWRSYFDNDEFTSNGIEFKGMKVANYGSEGGFQLKYLKKSDGTEVQVFGNYTWVNENYRTIVFADAPSFIAKLAEQFLKTSAYKAVSNETKSSGTYDSIAFINCTISKGTYTNCAFFGTTTITGGEFYDENPGDGSFNKKLADGYTFFKLSDDKGVYYKIIEAIEVWVLNETPSLAPIEFTSLSFYDGSSTQKREKIVIKDGVLKYGGYTAYSTADGWTMYRNTIAFTSAPTGDLLTWLQNNGTKQKSASEYFEE